MFSWVLGQWNVPDVAPAAKGQGSWYSIAWIDIDGNTDVTQIGTVQSVSADAHGNLSKNCYAFWEWWPESWQAISNFPVNFGDTMLGLICLDSPTEAWFSLLNLTSGIHAGFIFDASSGTVSQENQADWILERPAINGTTAQLPNFGEIYFDFAMGGHGLDFLADGGHGDKHGGERHNRGHHNRRDTDAHQDRLHRRLTARSRATARGRLRPLSLDAG
jgi:hypothetical protein